MDKVSKILLIVVGILLLILGIEAFLYFKSTSKSNSVKETINKTADKNEVLTLPNSNPTSDANNYSDYHFDGPAFIGTTKEGKMEVIYYRGIVKYFNNIEGKLTLEFNGKEQDINIGTNILVAVLTKDKKTGLTMKEGTIKDIQTGCLANVTAGINGNLNVAIEIEK